MEKVYSPPLGELQHEGQRIHRAISVANRVGVRTIRGPILPASSKPMAWRRDRYAMTRRSTTRWRGCGRIRGELDIPHGHGPERERQSFGPIRPAASQHSSGLAFAAAMRERAVPTAIAVIARTGLTEQAQGMRAAPAT